MCKICIKTHIFGCERLQRYVLLFYRDLYIVSVGLCKHTNTHVQKHTHLIIHTTIYLVSKVSLQVHFLYFYTIISAIYIVMLVNVSKRKRYD